MFNALKLRGISESVRRCRASGPGGSRLPRAASLHLFTYAGTDPPYNISRISRRTNRTNRAILRFSSSVPVSASPKNGSTRARYRRFSVNSSFEATINAFLGASGVQ
jgi:hypothetical protein